MLKEISKPVDELERNDMPAYEASNGYTFEEFTFKDGTIVERATKGKSVRWFLLEDED